MNQRTKKSIQEWESLIQQQEQSQLSQRQFCVENNIGYASFAKWRQKLKASNPEFLPINPAKVPSPTAKLSLTMGWGKFSLSLTL